MPNQWFNKSSLFVLLQNFSHIQYFLIYSLYSYSSAGTLLLSVTIGGSTTEYNYNNAGDLTHIFYASGSKRTFQYNSNSLLSLSEQHSTSGELLSSVTFLHNWNGKLTIIKQPENITRYLLFDTTGDILATEEQEMAPIFEVHTADVTYTKVVFGDQVSHIQHFFTCTCIEFYIVVVDSAGCIRVLF